jgi:hypothetical protein
MVVVVVAMKGAQTSASDQAGRLWGEVREEEEGEREPPSSDGGGWCFCLMGARARLIKEQREADVEL